MKPIFIILSLTLLFLASCGLLLGPLSEISLEQRMNSGWKSVYNFTYSSGYAISNIASSYSKLTFAKYLNGIQGIFSWFSQTSTYFYLGFFTTNSYQSSYYTGNTFPPLQNIFDVYCDKTNLSVFTGSNVPWYFYWSNGTPSVNNGLGLFTTAFNVLLADKSTMVGMSSGTNMYSYNGTTSNLMMTFTYSNTYTYLGKSKLQYNGDTLIFYINSSVSNGTNLQCFNYKTPGASLLTTPMPMSQSKPAILIESDGVNRLYMILGKALYKYDSSSKSFIMEYDNSGSILDPMGIYSAVYAGDNILILSVSSNIGSIRVCTYNTVSKNYSERVVTGLSANNIMSADIYYDSDTYRAYLGFLELPNTNSTSFNGYLYVNQM